MQSGDRRINPSWVLAVNGDLLALAAGVLAAFVVLPLHFVFREISLLALLARVGVTFLATYAAVYFLVYVGQWIIYNELDRTRRQQAALEASQQSRSGDHSGDTHDAT